MTHIMITGANADDKLALAKAIAGKDGFSVTATLDTLAYLSDAIFLVGAETLIVTGFNPMSDNLETAKGIIKREMITVCRAGHDPVDVKSPQFIFVTDNARIVKKAEVGRRLTLISIN